MMPRGCLQFVIVVFPDHTHYFGQLLWQDFGEPNFNISVNPVGRVLIISVDKAFFNH